MEVLIVGSVALDTVKTPYGVMEEGLGGSAMYSAVAASFFSPVKIVGVVGDDFPEKYIGILKKQKIDTGGLQRIKGGRTFRWSGIYEEKDLNSVVTLKTDLNVFADFHPILPEQYKKTPYIFLANIHPSLQMEVLHQLKSPKLVILDSMNLWIRTTKKELLDVLRKVDIFLLNDREAKMLCETTNLPYAANKILSMGPHLVIIKKGEHGAMMISKREMFSIPAYPIEDVLDPTGAGDAFAGGFIGYLASKDKVNEGILRQALAVGTVMASFNVQNFSLKGLLNVKKSSIKKRLETLKKFTEFSITEF